MKRRRKNILPPLGDDPAYHEMLAATDAAQAQLIRTALMVKFALDEEEFARSGPEYIDKLLADIVQERLENRAAE